MKTLPEKNKVALKAYGRITQMWGLSGGESAALATLPESKWQRSDYTHLNDEQILRISAVIGIFVALEFIFSKPISLEWFTLQNDGPLFHGSRPIDTAIAGGLSSLLEIRSYLEAVAIGA